MTALRLIRRDPTRNMARFYTLDIQGNLFGEWSLVREWGRIGCAGQVRATPYHTSVEATAALDRQRQAKQRAAMSAPARERRRLRRQHSCLGVHPSRWRARGAPGGGADAPPDHANGLAWRAHGEANLSEIGRSYNVSAAATISKLAP